MSSGLVTFAVAEGYERPSAAAKRLAGQIKRVEWGDWQALFDLARQAQALDGNDRLYALRVYAETVNRWRPEHRITNPWGERITDSVR